jgi:hypothetical protein
MNIALTQFEVDIARIKNLAAIYKVLALNTTSILDLSDILRAELVFSVSALDRYIHEIVRFGMLEVYTEHRSRTPQFDKFTVSMQSVVRGFSVEILDQEIRTQHGYKSFQRAEKIADAVRLISEIKLWDEVAKKLSKQPINVKNELDLIIKRRDQIAHEADSDPSYPDARWPIDEMMVNDAVAFIEKIVHAIHKVIV